MDKSVQPGERCAVRKPVQVAGLSPLPILSGSLAISLPPSLSGHTKFVNCCTHVSLAHKFLSPVQVSFVVVGYQVLSLG